MLPLYRARFNVAPTYLAWIVDLGGDRRVVRPATWNYLVDGERPLINLPPRRERRLGLRLSRSLRVATVFDGDRTRAACGPKGHASPSRECAHDND
jgi:hypothetical protein